MALTDYVTLNIVQNTVGIQRAGFGTGMLVSYVAAWPERTRTYGQLTDVATDFPNATGPEQRAAAAYFGQSPAPSALIIGRGSNKPTKTVQLSAVTPTGNVSYQYKVLVKGDGFADATVTFTSDGTPTDAEYAAGMVTALNAVASKNYTAAGASSPITITGNSAGAWFSIQVADVNTQQVVETTADPGIAADLTAITAENPGWYGLLLSCNSQPLGHAAAAWVEANNRLFIAASNDSRSVTTSTGTGDLIDDLKTNSYTRSSGWYHPDPSAFIGAALLGKCFPFEPGSVNFAFKTLAGVATFSMTATHRTNITARNGNSYESVAGLGVTFYGNTGDGKFLDTRRNLDWLQDDMGKSVFGALAAASIVPMTDPGIAVIESQVRGSLKRAADKGILIESTIVVTVPTAASISANDRAVRLLQNVKFSGQLQGAVNKTIVNGGVTA
jgi:hypothetical protein